MTRGKILALAALFIILATGCAPVLEALDRPENQRAIIDAPKTVGGVLGGLGIPVSDAAGAVTSTLLAAGFALYNYLRKRKAEAAVGQMASALEGNRSDGGHDADNMADRTAEDIKKLGNALIDAIVAKVPK